MPKVSLIGYAPDADPTTAGVMTNCAAILPTVRGFKAAPSVVATSLPALAAACQGAAVVRKLDNTTRLFAATGTAIYEDGGSSWTDVTRSVGGAYSPASDLRWSFAQYNDTTLAAVKSDTLQFSASGKFEDVTGAPKASVVATVNEFVFLFDTNEGIYGDSPNRWWCAAQGNYTDWTPATATNCYTGTLTSSPGKIRAGHRFGDSIIAYKDRAMYLGYFAGNPVGWRFTELPGETGALSNEVVVNIGTPENPKHIFMGYNDFFVFDGTRPQPIGAGIIRDAVYDSLNRTYSHTAMALHDATGGRVFFFYPTSGSPKPDKCVVYNYKTLTWGRDDRTIEAVIGYVTSGISYDNMGASYSTYDDISSALSYDTAFFYAGTPVNAIIDENHILKTLTGAATSSSFTTGDYGDDSAFSLLQRVKPRFVTAPTAATMINYYKSELSDSLTTDATTSLSSNRFDVLREARWHRARFDFTGDMEIIGLVYDAVAGGYE